MRGEDWPTWGSTHSASELFNHSWGGSVKVKAEAARVLCFEMDLGESRL